VKDWKDTQFWLLDVCSYENVATSFIYSLPSVKNTLSCK